MMKQVITALFGLALVAGLNNGYSQTTSPTVGVFTKVVQNDADLVDAEELPADVESETGIEVKKSMESRVIKDNMSETDATLALIEKYSAILKINPQNIMNMALYRFIEDWYGTRYRMGGTSKSGIDCSAFTQKLYNTVFNNQILRTAILQFRSSDYIANRDSLKEGDLVFFRTGGGAISHVGVYLHNHYFVHSSSSKGVMISNLDEAYWRRCYAGGGRM